MEEVVNQAPPPPPPPPVASRPVPTAPTNGLNGAVKGKPTPPVPPTKRPAAKKPVANGGGRGSTNDSSMAGSLAEALRQRQAAMSSQRQNNDW